MRGRRVRGRPGASVVGVAGNGGLWVQASVGGGVDARAAMGVAHCLSGHPARARHRGGGRRGGGGRSWTGAASALAPSDGRRNVGTTVDDAALPLRVVLGLRIPWRP